MITFTYQELVAALNCTSRFAAHNTVNLQYLDSMIIHPEGYVRRAFDAGIIRKCDPWTLEAPHCDSLEELCEVIESLCHPRSWVSKRSSTSRSTRAVC